MEVENMSEDQKSNGKCVFCGQSSSKFGMTRHLKSCNKRTQQISEINGKSTDKINIFHLLIQDAYGGDHWSMIIQSASLRASRPLGRW
jgi:Tfp pilus assembly major pilin PilA